ncbi:uncharacterized protein EV420DRAFT_1337733 [Desarmillaria tabescens]|uniref:Uncharacterized protein n=1 Tax=Armillaria tabescens TaxID=1929756 RepID=A0AA39K0Z5_ARMTA|nr:uncharacterized protein EV420DRAFT_1337733 [Desarmillaria tabescens]KAK0451149.1 hypothetical protein EV420DRAFT_1337733 [Desarmillaria tabescens]
MLTYKSDPARSRFLHTPTPTRFNMRFLPSFISSELANFRQFSSMLDESSIQGNVTLQAAGLIALADISAVTIRTALTGSESVFDVLVIAPGMHLQQSAGEINHGEFPTTGAMTTGYVFRVENPATVSYLQNIGITGRLVTAHVDPSPSFDENLSEENKLLQSLFVAGVPATLLYALCPALTIVVVVLLGVVRDWWALGSLGGFVLARFINMVVIKRRNEKGWKGVPEKGQNGDLLILLSQDRWVRLRGTVEDLKAVTAGQWLRDLTATESFAVTCATMLIYVSAVLAFNASTVGCLLIAGLLLSTVALLTLCNSSTQCLQMCDRIVRRVRISDKYPRRRVMADQLVAETGRKDWAVGMGLILPDPGERGAVNV